MNKTPNELWLEKKEAGDFFEDQFTCPICGSDKIVPPVGNEKAPILLVGLHPAEEELEKGIPMVGAMGRVLRAELGYLGFDLKSTRRTNLWLHPPNKNKDCLDYSMQQVIKEAKGRKLILLLGDDVVKVFTGKNVMNVAGLKLKSDYFSCPVVCSPNPAIVFQQGKGVGETRLALTKFIKYVKEIIE